tara:strand:+ start:537 stop:707 length:171 start_codon:yes stop_codon:yes gene_type:complete
MVWQKPELQNAKDLRGKNGKICMEKSNLCKQTWTLSNTAGIVEIKRVVSYYSVTVE